MFRAEFEKRKVNPLDIHLENAIRKMQQINQLEVVGVLNTETCRKINETLVDPLPIHKIRNRIRRFSYNDFKWEKQNITYWLVIFRNIFKLKKKQINLFSKFFYRNVFSFKKIFLPIVKV